MYFGNIKALKAQHIEGKFNESDSLKYYIAVSIILSLVLSFPEEIENSLDRLTSFIGLIINILGIIYWYKSLCLMVGVVFRQYYITLHCWN